MKRVTAFFIVLSSFGSLHAQDFVVTQKNDTLVGDVRILTHDILDRIQVTDQLGKHQFTATQVKTVAIKKDIYSPVLGLDGYRMMKYVKGGFLSEYLARRADGVSYEVVYLVKKNGQAIELPNLTFKKVMSDFVLECPEVSDKIAKGELGKRSLDAIIQEYNDCLDNRTRAINQASAAALEDPKIVSVMALLDRVKKAPEFPGQKDAADAISDVASKVGNKQAIPNYLLEGIRSLLKDCQDCAAEFEKVATQLKNP